MERIWISDLSQAYLEKEVIISGWVKSIRHAKKFSFVSLNDGSTFSHLQIIYDADKENYEKLKETGLGACLEFTGKLVESQGKGQSFELQGSQFKVLGAVADNYPLQKKETSLEFLREQAHLRPRTNTFSAVFRLRHLLAKAVHDFFDERGFYYLNSPIITTFDGEGAGDMFSVTKLDLKNIPKNNKGEVDFSQDYFAKRTNLCVTGQLESEVFASSLGRVYTFGPTFRAENSNTTRHLSEFWMIEPEMAFTDLKGNAQLGQDFIQYLIQRALDKGSESLEFLAKTYAPENLKTLEHVAQGQFESVSYTEAVEILQKSGEKFEYQPKWGEDLQTEHERFLTEKHFKKPVTVMDYPKEIKAFYMRQNDDGKTVAAMDILVPGVGEIIGGSQREEREDLLLKRLQECHLDPKEYWWYLELRKFGSCPHSGFGLGFERILMYITGMANIRDVIPFPRTPKNCDF